MKALIVLLAIFSLTGKTQTTVYARSAAPAGVTVCGATNATPIVIQTCTAHNLASTCGSSTTCYVTVQGVSTGTGASPANGVFQAHTTCSGCDATHYALYDKTANTAIAGTGTWWAGGTWTFSGPVASWAGQVNPFTVVAEPAGYMDGPNGTFMRRLSIWPGAGLAASSAVVVSGGSGGSCASVACTITVATSYNPVTGQGNYPVAVGRNFSITGTGTVLDTCGNWNSQASGDQSSYPMATVSSTGWTATVTCTGLTTGDYTSTQTVCGPAGTPNDTIGGSQSCTSISQLATTANPWWTGLLTRLSNAGGFSAPNYKWVYDGGQQDGGGVAGIWGISILYGFVDRKNTLGPWLATALYALNNIEEGYGQNFVVNELSYGQASNAFSVGDFITWSFLYDYAVPYWTASERTTFLNKMYNDVDDPSVGACSKTAPDVSTPATHNWQLASGTAQAGSSTSITLSAGDSAVNTYYVNTVVQLANNSVNDYNHFSYGLVTAYNSTTKVATVAGGFSGSAPTSNVLISGTYTNGLTCTGKTGQFVWITFPNGANAYVSLTGANAIAIGSPLVVFNPGSGFVTAPSVSTGVFANGSSAVCTGTANVSTTIGVPYIIYDTVTSSSSSHNATVTMTWTKTTNISSTVNVGDAIQALNGWFSTFHPGGCVVTATSTSSVTCINPGYASTTIPQMAWRFVHWTAGDCGMLWASKHIQGLNADAGATGALYVAFTSFSSNNTMPEMSNYGVGSASFQMAMDLAAAADDSRAVRDFTRAQSYLFDWQWRPFMDYLGAPHDGGNYYSAEDAAGVAIEQKLVQSSLTGYPALDLTGPWLSTWAQVAMFGAYPDLLSGTPSMLTGGGQGPGIYNGQDGLTIGSSLAGIFGFQPQSNTAGYFRNWMETVRGYGSSPNSMWSGSYASGLFWPLYLFWDDPGIPSSTYSVQPHQYISQTSSSAACVAQTGWPCNQYRGDMAWSRTGWRSLTDSLMLFDTRSYANGYDSVQAGGVKFYKASPLLGCDNFGLGNLDQGDTTIKCDAIQFSGAQSQWPTELNNGVPPNGTGSVLNRTNVTAWASANAGSLGSAYGDNSSRYAYVCANEANAYNQAALSITVNYVNRCVVHFKSGTIPAPRDEFLFQLDDISNSSTAVATHLQYWQTGQTIAGAGENTSTGYTICVDNSITPADCALLNTNRIIKSVEFGGTATGGGPNQIYGLLTQVFSPGTIDLTWDIPGTFNGANNPPQPQANSGNTYPNGQGYTDRIAINAGASPGASVTGATWGIAHKVMQTLSDATYTATGIQPDSHWYGVAAKGQTSAAVYVQSLGNVTHSIMTSFTYASALPVDWVIGGVTPGTYAVTVGGSPVTGSPFIVTAGDTSIYFNTAGGGAVAVLAGGSGSQLGTSISGNASMTGNVIIH